MHDGIDRPAAAPAAPGPLTIVVAAFGRSRAWTISDGHKDRIAHACRRHRVVFACDNDALRQHLPSADIALTSIVDRDLIPRLARLRWVQAPAAAMEHLPLKDLAALGVAVTNARSLRARAMAEHVLGMLIALARNWPLAMRAQQVATWAHDEIEGSRLMTLRDRRIAVFGVGAVGSEVARLASAIGLRVTGIRRRSNRTGATDFESIVGLADADAVLRESDAMVLALPLTQETRRVIDAARLAACKHGTLLINVGRGELLDDDAVIAALRSGRLRGAALDVFTREPLEPSSPYWNLPNVVITPHTSGSQEDYWTGVIELFTRNLCRVESGQPLINLVDADAGY